MAQLTPFLKSVLEQPGVVVLPGNSRYLKNFAGSGGHVHVQPSGHLVFYGACNRRFLMTDPEGHPLHECEWHQDASGQTHLVAARLHLEWGEWVGIRPEGLVNSISLDLSTRPGWERLTRDDLRNMAARNLSVSLEQICFFYRDEDLVVDPSGRVTIRQRKDAFYVLHEGRFERAKFMSCMSRISWERIDYLPVVELFLSLLPGTGSAAFELIRGLYDDQNPKDPLPLHYRGIPVYPSEGAFRLFSQFFTPSVPGSTEDPLSIFLDSTHSDKVVWLPCVDPPLRYFDPRQQLCVTVKQGHIQKGTFSDDPSGLSYFRSPSSGIAHYGQSVSVNGGNLVFSNGLTTRKIPIKSSWKISSQPDPHPSPQTFPTWHQLFPEGCPRIQPTEAFSTALLYPDNESLIGEIESQPFAMDYFDDLLDENPNLKAHMASANQLLFSQCDAAINSCLRLDRQRSVTILYTSPQLAQKQAQNLWNSLARIGKLKWIESIAFRPYSEGWQNCFDSYNVLFLWIPFIHFQNSQILDQTTHDIKNVLQPNGIGFVVGPSQLAKSVTRSHLELLDSHHVTTLPTFRLHQAILPRARLNPDLAVFVLRKDR